MKIRLARPDDVKFVLDTWSKTYRLSPWAGVVPNNLWHETIRELITQLLARGAYIIVGADSADDTRIKGWVCVERRKDGMVLHYAFTRPEDRRQRVATALLEWTGERDARWFYTGRTHKSRYLCRNMTYAPEIARRA